MTHIHIGDIVQLHLVGAHPGSLGDGGIVTVAKIEDIGGRLLYTGVWEHGSVQFRGGECTIIKRALN